MESNYRIFISYSHEDIEEVKKIITYLKDLNLSVWWDKNFKWGLGFQNQIKNYIKHAHVFIPIITENSSQRGWVHQEIGYAMAMNVPVLPITWGSKEPGEMLRELHAISWDHKSGSFHSSLKIGVIENLVKMAEEEAKPLYECAIYHQNRTMMLVQYAKTVKQLGEKGMLRQKSHLSSLHIPDKHIDHRLFQEREGNLEREEFAKSWLRKERLIMEEHVAEKGFKLIINPYIEYAQYDDYANKAKKSRLNVLLETLNKYPSDENHLVAINKKTEANNLTMIGDWFLAETWSHGGVKGYKQTIFTRHTPTIRSSISRFDQEVLDLLSTEGIPPTQSKDWAVEEIKKILQKLDH